MITRDKTLNRRQFLQLAAALGASLVTVGVSSGCQKSGEQEQTLASTQAGPQAGGDLVIGLAAEAIVTLDPAAHNDQASETISRHLFDRLLGHTPDNQLVLQLAQDYRWLDKWTLEFDLKRGVRFHNGDRLTADDVVFSFDRILTQDIGAPRRLYVRELERAEKTGNYTVRFYLKRPWSVFPSTLVNIPIVPRTYLTRVGDAEFARQPIGSGPFKFVEASLNEQVVLERFDDYYDGPAHLAQVTFRMIPDVSARVDALASGQAHLIQDVPPHLADQLTKRDDVVIQTICAPPLLIDLNVTQPPFDNVRVRQALNYAVDVDAILAQQVNGYGTPLAGPFSLVNGCDDDGELVPYGYDPQKAVSLLAEASYRPQDLSFVIDCYAAHTELAQMVAEQLQTLEMDVTVQTWAADELEPQLLNCERQALLHAWRDAALDAVACIEARWQTRVEETGAGRANYSCYTNDELDKLAKESMAELDAEKRQALCRQAQSLIYQQAPAIFLYTPQAIQAALKQVSGWQAHQDSHIYLHEVWLADD